MIKKIFKKPRHPEHKTGGAEQIRTMDFHFVQTLVIFVMPFVVNPTRLVVLAV